MILLAFGLFNFSCGDSEKTEKPQALDTSELAEKSEDNSGIPAKSRPHPGQQVYNQHCKICHQADGSGVYGVFPPLTPNKYIEDKQQFITLMLRGMTGKIKIDGVEYNNIMVPHDHLSNQELADVISYVRSSFGNQLGPVTKEEVATARNK